MKPPHNRIAVAKKKKKKSPTCPDMRMSVTRSRDNQVQSSNDSVYALKISLFNRWKLAL